MRKKGDTADGAVAVIAARQHGVVSSAQLVAAGLTREAISRRVRAGRLHRVHQGVYAVGHPRLSTQGKWMAAVLACGRIASNTTDSVLGHWGAAVSHRSAAALWQLLPANDGPVDVSVPTTAGHKQRRGIRLHRCRVLPPACVISRDRIPVTTPERTIADLRRLAATRDRPGSISANELRRAIRQAEVLGLPIELDSTLAGTRSDLELAFLQLCRRHDLPEPEVNVKIGALEVDFLWRQRHLIVETDGYRYHRGRAAFESDRARDLALRAAGYEVIRLSEQQINEEAGPVAQILKKLLSPGAVRRT